MAKEKSDPYQFPATLPDEPDQLCALIDPNGDELSKARFQFLAKCLHEKIAFMEELQKKGAKYGGTIEYKWSQPIAEEIYKKLTQISNSYERADDLLTAIETRAEKIKTLRGKLTTPKAFDLSNDFSPTIMEAKAAGSTWVKHIDAIREAAGQDRDQNSEQKEKDKSRLTYDDGAKQAPYSAILAKKIGTALIEHPESFDIFFSSPASAVERWRKAILKFPDLEPGPQKKR